MSAKNEPNKPDDSNANEVDVPRLVRIEVDLIETRRYTKTIELPEEFANRVIGKLWANDSRGGLSEADCIAACLETPGPISREVIENECDTIDVLDVYEPNEKCAPAQHG